MSDKFEEIKLIEKVDVEKPLDDCVHSRQPKKDSKRKKVKLLDVN